MLELVKKSFVALLLVGTLLSPVWASTSTVSADGISDCLSNGTSLNNLSVGTGDCVKDPKQNSGSADLTNLVTLIVNTISIIVGVIAVIMIIFGGFKYITSGGDANNTKSAKNTIMYALIGLVIVALAQFIVRFVLTKASDLNPTPTPAAGP